MRGDDGRLTFERSYHFEFSSDGIHRSPGQVETRGTRVIRVELAPHRWPGPDPAEGPPPPTA